MIEKEIRNAWYADVRLDGGYVCLLPGQHLETHLGNVAFTTPNNPMLFPRVPRNGDFRIVAAANDDSGNFEYNLVVWNRIGTPFGVNPVIYQNDHSVLQATSSHQGYRFVDLDGTVYTGDQTYSDPANHFNEWTRIAGFQVGLSPVTGSTDRVVVQLPSGERRVVGGVSKYLPNSIHFDSDGHNHVLCFTDSTNSTAYLKWLTTQELRALFPLEQPIGPPVDPPIEPPIDPPDPEIPVRLPDNVYNTLVALRPKYPTPLVNNGAKLLNEVAWTHRAEGYGLEQKDGGNNCGCPGISVRMGCDILRTLTLGWDCLQDAEGVGNPVQSDSGPADPARFVAPVNPGTTPPTEPPADPALEQRVTTLEAKVAAQQVQLTEQKELLAAQEIALSELDQRVFDLEAEDPTEPPEAAPDSLPVTLRAFGENYSGILDKEE